MHPDRRAFVPRWHYGFLATIALATAAWTVGNNPERLDSIGTLIRPNLSALVPQSVILMFLMWQVLTYKSAASLVAIRLQGELIQKKLLLLVASEVSLYFIIYYGMFGFSGIKWFIDGSVLIGCLVLGIRYLTMLLLGFGIVGAYQARHPGVILVATLLLSLLEHYWLEGKYLLILYTPLYDPLYRALHHIYQ